MKKLFILVPILLLVITNVYSNGVAIIDGKNGLYLRLNEIDVEISVENQVAIVKTIQRFKNTSGSETKIKYAFPLPPGASATGLRWKTNGSWSEANIGATPQDTTLPGPSGEINENLKQYLGETPLYFDIMDLVQADSLIEVEITYVELLPYSFGNVQFVYPNNYSLIQSSYVNLQEFYFNLTSSRKIDSLRIVSSHPVSSLSNDGFKGEASSEVYESPANEDFIVSYTLNLEELGLFSLSTLIPSSELPDELGGFFLFVAEPDPSTTTDVINKIFTLIIDRSGSMEWEDRLIQAKSAASYIIQNLNEGDKFNIVDFARFATNFRDTHVEYNNANKTAALEYIDQLEPTWTAELSGTNISGAFDTAIPQFSAANDSTANIIIFLTDGEATWGILDTEGILSHVQSLVQQNETQISLFTFGLGQNINVQLLTLLASQNNGLSEFVGNDEVEERIKDFYRKIRYPVLLNAKVSFSPSIITETYPITLPSLYKGQQMHVTGRYNELLPVTVTLSGTAFGDEISYDYQLELSDSANTKYQFLPKVWAKQKIEYLLIQYYSLDPNSTEAQEIKNQIIDISISYTVISPFTSFQNPVGIKDDVVSTNTEYIPNQIELLGNYPNPFNPSTKICFKVHSNFSDYAIIKIFNSIGELIRVIAVNINKPGIYEILWDGSDQMGKMVSSGTYIYIIDFGELLLHGKMQLIK